MTFCYSCKIELTHDNWNVSAREHHNNICRSCKRAVNYEYRQRVKAGHVPSLRTSPDNTCRMCISPLVVGDNWSKAKCAKRIQRCDACSYRAYNERHKKSLENQREFQANNREYVNQKNRSWRSRNPQKLREAVDRWKLANPEKVREYAEKAKLKRAQNRAAKKKSLGVECTKCHVPLDNSNWYQAWQELEIFKCASCNVEELNSAHYAYVDKIENRREDIIKAVGIRRAEYERRKAEKAAREAYKIMINSIKE